MHSKVWEPVVYWLVARCFHLHYPSSSSNQPVNNSSYNTGSIKASWSFLKAVPGRSQMGLAQPLAMLSSTPPCISPWSSPPPRPQQPQEVPSPSCPAQAHSSSLLLPPNPGTHPPRRCHSSPLSQANGFSSASGDCPVSSETVSFTSDASPTSAWVPELCFPSGHLLAFQL